MKILMTTDTLGGVWTYSLELVWALASRGARVWLAAKGKPSVGQQAEARRLPNALLLQEEFKLEWMPDPWQDLAAADKWLLDIAERVQPDVVHLNDYCHGALPWGSPVIMVGHSCVLSWTAAVRRVDEQHRWRRYREAVTRGLRAANLVVAPTTQMLHSLNYFYGPLGRQRVIHNGCDPSRRRRGQKQPYVFSAGRFWDEAKNISTLADAAPLLDWPLAVAGLRHPDGADGRVNGIQWLGQLSPDEMALNYSQASIYALPARYEPFGLTALEAALSGCALVLGDIPSLREVWGDAAVYVSPESVEELAAAINDLSRRRMLRTRMAERAHTRARQLTARRMASEYWRCYRELAPASASALDTVEAN